MKPDPPRAEEIARRVLAKDYPAAGPPIETELAIAQAAIDATLDWIIARWGPCCYATGDLPDPTDYLCTETIDDEPESWCPACVARRERGK